MKVSSTRYWQLLPSDRTESAKNTNRNPFFVLLLRFQLPASFLLPSSSSLSVLQRNSCFSSLFCDLKRGGYLLQHPIRVLIHPAATDSTALCNGQGSRNQIRFISVGWN
ncbi:hypothetical protein NE237_009522 [Protea cynaroides]|uniref:Uncharacterized protein n=1 Tax=Protea cynaroides TaxID=273540 RepID=A0A9Q0KXL3_9MAGN|nr:hypothetical protein NE237_009522 [Protea cynaroides]